MLSTSIGKEAIGRMLDTRLLQAHMVLKGVTTKTFADAQGWSLRKAYRKIKGETAFTVPEVQVCKDLLELDPPTTSAIFFAADLS